MVMFGHQEWLEVDKGGDKKMVGEAGVKENQDTYTIDKDGDVSRAKMARGRK